MSDDCPICGGIRPAPSADTPPVVSDLPPGILRLMPRPVYTVVVTGDWILYDFRPDPRPTF